MTRLLHLPKARPSGERWAWLPGVIIWPDEQLRGHQPPTGAEQLAGRFAGIAAGRAKRVATLAAKRRPGEDALVEYLRGLALPATVTDVARGSYYRRSNLATRRLPRWPESRSGAQAWLRRLEAQGRVEKTPEGWRAKECNR